MATALSGAVLDALRVAWTNGARLASICTGAFVLAETGLLDGRRATTHWLVVAEFARRFPRVTLDPDVLFVDEGRIVTSAGALAAMDMCLHLVRRDYGQAAAAHAARLAVAPLNRDGGQAQFIRHDLPWADRMAPLLDWMLLHLHQPLDVATLAARVGKSPGAHCRIATPPQWLKWRRSHLKRADLPPATTSSPETMPLGTASSGNGHGPAPMVGPRELPVL